MKEVTLKCEAKATVDGKTVVRLAGATEEGHEVSVKLSFAEADEKANQYEAGVTEATAAVSLPE